MSAAVSNVWRERRWTVATMTPRDWRFWVLIIGPSVLIFATLANFPIASTLGLVAVSFLLSFSFRRLAPLLGVLIFLPFQGLITDTMSTDFPWVAILKDILIVWAFALFLWRVPRRRLYEVDPFTLGFSIFAIMCCVYVVFSPNLLRAVLEFRGLVLYPVLAIVVKNIVEGKRDVRKLLRVLAIMGAFAIIYGLFQYFSTFDVPYREIRSDFGLRAARFGDMALISTFASRPDCGVFLVSVFLLVLLVPLWKSSTFVVITRVALLAGAITCTFLTFSRTAWIAMVVGVTVALLIKNRIKAIPIVLMLAVIVAWLYRSELRGAPLQVRDAATDYASLAERIDVWGNAKDLFISKPFGTGLGTVGGALVFEMNQYSIPTENQMLFTDNQFLKLLVEGGLPLELAFAGLLLSILYLTIKVLRGVEDPWLRSVAIWSTASCASLFVTFLTVDYLGSSNSFPIYWTAVGLMGWQFSLLKEHKSRPSDWFGPAINPKRRTPCG